MDRRQFLQFAAAIAAFSSRPELCSADGGSESAYDGFTLWQLPSQTPSQMMGYVLRTAGGKVMVIDGGMTGDSPYLRGFLAALGNRADLWFISHPHGDHVGAVTAILNDPAGISIGCMYGSLPAEEWIKENELAGLNSARNFYKALANSDRKVHELTPDQIIELDNLQIEILAVKNPEITVNAENNSSVVMRVAGSGKTILFTGDLGVEGGRKLLQSDFKSRLRADYVQMAHHGQNGVEEDFYRAVAPKYCLWPTPRWLWDNDNGAGKGSGPWRTLEVRAWMDKHSVARHYVAADGLHRIDF